MSDTSSRKKTKRQPKFDLKQKSVSLEPTIKSQSFSSHDQSSRLRRTTSAEPMPKIPELKETFDEKKKEKKLSRKNTIHEKSEEQRKESEKRQRMLARAKSLNDLNRRVVSGFNTGLNYDSSSNLSASSVSSTPTFIFSSFFQIDSLSDIDFTAAMDLLKPSRSSPLSRSQSQAVLHPTKSIIRREQKKQKHTVSFRH